MNRIVLYSDEFPVDIWKNYCRICDVPNTATQITITFKDNDVKYK